MTNYRDKSLLLLGLSVMLAQVDVFPPALACIRLASLPAGRQASVYYLLSFPLAGMYPFIISIYRYNAIL